MAMTLIQITSKNIIPNEKEIEIAGQTSTAVSN